MLDRKFPAALVLSPIAVPSGVPTVASASLASFRAIRNPFITQEVDPHLVFLKIYPPKHLAPDGGLGNGRVLAVFQVRTAKIHEKKIAHS
jgi:hypothetical protein